MKIKLKSTYLPFFLLVIFFVAGIELSVILVLGLLNYFKDKPWPGVVIAQQSVGFKEYQEIIQVLNENIVNFDKLVMVSGGKSWTIELSSVDWQPLIHDSTIQAIDYAKYLPEINQLSSLLHEGITLPLVYRLNDTNLKSELDLIAEEIFIPANMPKILVSNQPPHEIYIENGTVGQQIDLAELEKKVRLTLTAMSTEPIVIPLNVTDYQLTEKEKVDLENKARILANKTLTLKHNDIEFVWHGEKLANLLIADKHDPDLLGTNTFCQSKSDDVVCQSEFFDVSKITTELNNIAASIDVSAQNAVFTYNHDTNRVEEYIPEILGEKIALDRSKIATVDQLHVLIEQPVTVANVLLETTVVKPEITIDQINNLGIKELLGKGDSEYKGSTPGRKYNVALAAERINGVVIEPGTKFSFNQQVGEVSALTGYKKSFVIRSGETVLDDGGGVCQVSTTVFRAVLNAGLAVSERKAHSYRVGYYEQNSKSGLDATVYSPSADLAFINDTPAHILIQTKIDEKASHLTVEIYGTNDGRSVEITPPKMWSVAQPPDDQYVDDPTLPTGTTKQIEYKAWGAKVSFDWKVSKNGEILHEKTFYSNYRPWQAVYLRGTGI